MLPPPTEGIRAVGKLLEFQPFDGTVKQVPPSMGFDGKKVMWFSQALPAIQARNDRGFMDCNALSSPLSGSRLGHTQRNDSGPLRCGEINIFSAET